MLQELRAAVASKLDVSEDVDTAALVEWVRSPATMTGDAKATRITALSLGAQETAKQFDVDGTGGFSRANVTSILRAHGTSVKESQRMKKILGVAAALLVFMFAGMFLLSYLAIDMAKEMRADDSGIMYTSDGTVARVGSSDFDVSEDGTLVCNRDKVSAMDSGGRRLTESQAVVATEEVASERILHAALPDAFFESLKKVTAHSPKGHHLTLNVMGFARVPVLNSRCGNIVYLFTSWGPRLSLDSFDLSFDAELEDMFKNAGFEILVGGVNGRRLASADVSIAGLFNHISSMEDSGSWTCDEVPLPVITEFYYPRRLRRITAASCLFGIADVAERCGQRSAKISAMCSPNRFGKLSENMWGKMNTKRKRNRKSKTRSRRRRKRLLGASWGALGACWELPGGLLEASWGPPWAYWGRSGASWGPLWQS